LNTDLERHRTVAVIPVDGPAEKERPRGTGTPPFKVTEPPALFGTSPVQVGVHRNEVDVVTAPSCEGDQVTAVVVISPWARESAHPGAVPLRSTRLGQAPHADDPGCL
jgi:hypothetical protein